jgi:hypothetical protein
MQDFRKFPKAPDPESRENRNIAGGQKTSRFDCQYHYFFWWLHSCMPRVQIFLAPAKQNQRPFSA